MSVQPDLFVIASPSCRARLNVPHYWSEDAFFRSGSHHRKPGQVVSRPLDLPTGRPGIPACRDHGAPVIIHLFGGCHYERNSPFGNPGGSTFVDRRDCLRGA